MEYKTENKTCQNCKKDFTIEPEDFKFYEKIKVPPPTWCPWCRLLRRMVWRNERALYKRNCDLCKKSTISMYPADTIFPVYCHDCWWSDEWEAISFGQNYDFSRSFFDQFKELQAKVPRFALWQRNVVDCEYSNFVGESKNVYLSASVVVKCKNVFYSKNIDSSYNIFDCCNLKNCEQCYENVEGAHNYNSQHLALSRNCIDSFFLVDCANCSNCFMCSNLRNKQFYIKNKKYSREEYLEEMKNFESLGSRIGRKILLEEFENLKKNAIYRFANILQSANSTGHNIFNTKNSKNCFDVYDAENFKYCYRAFTSKDSMDYAFSQTSELMYEYITGGNHNYDVKFCYSAIGNVKEAQYSDSCVSSSNLFGCIGVKNKENVILNKKYPKEEFLKLKEQIMKQMNELPYVDKGGRKYQYGEYFPMDICPFAYNESTAREFESITKEEGMARGYKWKDFDLKSQPISLEARDIPDNIKDVKDDIIKEVVECEHREDCDHLCSKAFRITKSELQFYKKNNIPIPDKCPNCRYFERFSQIPVPKLYKGECACRNEKHFHAKEKCKNQFLTPYQPGILQKVYCESCYNKEVY